MKYLVALMILVAQSAQAKWTAISEEIDGTQYYIDMQSVRFNGSYRTYWSLENSTRDKFSPYSIRRKEEIDCAQERKRSLRYTRFDRLMATGRVSLESDLTSQWQYIPPASVEDTFLKLLCAP